MCCAYFMNCMSWVRLVAYCVYCAYCLYYVYELESSGKLAIKAAKVSVYVFRHSKVVYDCIEHAINTTTLLIYLRLYSDIHQ